jgi:hypothetical protein
VVNNGSGVKVGLVFFVESSTNSELKYAVVIELLAAPVPLAAETAPIVRTLS